MLLLLVLLLVLLLLYPWLLLLLLLLSLWHRKHLNSMVAAIRDEDAALLIDRNSTKITELTIV